MFSCTAQQQLIRNHQHNPLSGPGLENAHIGISIYDPLAGKYLYEYNGDKYFVPASNTKLFSCYAAMKFLGDSVPGLEVREFRDKIVIRGSGDPGFLDPEFPDQPVFEFLNRTDKSIQAVSDSLETGAWGSGWSWSDYDGDYMAERSVFPIYCNLIWFYGSQGGQPKYFPNVEERPSFRIRTSGSENYLSGVSRKLRANMYSLQLEGDTPHEYRVPFITDRILPWRLLSDTLHKEIQLIDSLDVSKAPLRSYIIYSRPLDSLLKPMMHRSDNFFAEQSLLMVSNQLLGSMTNTRIIDTLLKTHLRFLPQRPRWEDGSGLSRYNLFTPEDFVALLNQMRLEFGLERIKTILPTGGEGTLGHLYLEESGQIYAKTGTLSGVVALSGFLTTIKGRQLVFSILVNNHNTSATTVRKSIEQFLKSVRKKY
ncbi:hypothetical protein GCM10027051_07920 [Niabella terrae]